MAKRAASFPQPASFAWDDHHSLLLVSASSPSGADDACRSGRRGGHGRCLEGLAGERPAGRRSACQAAAASAEVRPRPPPQRQPPSASTTSPKVDLRVARIVAPRARQGGVVSGAGGLRGKRVWISL